MIYLDSNIFLYPITDPGSKKGIAAKNILIKLAKGELEAMTSSLTWDELVWVTRKAFSMELAILEGRRFLEFPNVKIISADANVLYFSQRLIETYKIAPRDSIHAATAIIKNVTEFVSDDSDFDKIKEIKRKPI
jgi:predicted nucleic acid-binding protein